AVHTNDALGCEETPEREKQQIESVHVSDIQMSKKFNSFFDIEFSVFLFAKSVEHCEELHQPFHFSVLEETLYFAKTVNQLFPADVLKSILRAFESSAFVGNAFH